MERTFQDVRGDNTAAKREGEDEKRKTSASAEEKERGRERQKKREREESRELFPLRQCNQEIERNLDTITPSTLLLLRWMRKTYGKFFPEGARRRRRTSVKSLGCFFLDPGTRRSLSFLFVQISLSSTESLKNLARSVRTARAPGGETKELNFD